jgi:hypothetical protein
MIKNYIIYKCNFNNKNKAKSQKVKDINNKDQFMFQIIIIYKKNDLNLNMHIYNSCILDKL